MPPVTWTDHREGVILYRLAEDGALAAHTGDANEFCVQLPPGIVSADFTLTWSDPRPLLLEFQSDNARYSNWEDDPVQAFMVTSPSSLHVEAPRAGVWQIWIGPPVADGARVWSLDISWTAIAGTTTEEVPDVDC